MRNPPYKRTEQNKHQKEDMESIFAATLSTWKSFDYILGFFQKAKTYLENVSNTSIAFVTTNSICQGEQVYRFWPQCLTDGTRIRFAVTSFKWANLASNNAGVTVCIIGLSRNVGSAKLLMVLMDM